MFKKHYETKKYPLRGWARKFNYEKIYKSGRDAPRIQSSIDIAYNIAHF